MADYPAGAVQSSIHFDDHATAERQQEGKDEIVTSKSSAIINGFEEIAALQMRGKESAFAFVLKGHGL